MKSDKSLLLKWTIINTSTIGIFTTAVILSRSYLSSLPFIGIAFVSATILVYIVSALYAASLTLKDQANNVISYEANVVSFWANMCPMIGLIGAVTGISYSLTGNVHSLDASNMLLVVKRSMEGAGIAWIPTIAGMFFYMSLAIQAFYIKHAAGR